MSNTLVQVTDENIEELHEDLQALRGAPKGSTSGGGGGYHDRMEARVSALEEAVKNLPTKADLDVLLHATKEDLDALRKGSKEGMDALRKETKADWLEFTNSSRADFAALRADIAKGQADMHKAIVDNHRWTHVALMGLAAFSVAGIVGVMGTIWSIGKPAPQAAPPQPAQQPIIINVPAAGTPPATQQRPAP